MGPPPMTQSHRTTRSRAADLVVCYVFGCGTCIDGGNGRPGFEINGSHSDGAAGMTQRQQL